jgi:hypothetical protein
MNERGARPGETSKNMKNTNKANRLATVVALGV